MNRNSVFLAAALADGVFTSAASAAKPTREPANITDATFPGICSFTVARRVLVDRTIITTYSDGTQRYTGAFKQRIINLATGKFIDVNSRGPVIIETHPDGSATERDFGPQFSRPPGQLLLTTGPVVYEHDPAGNIVSFTQRGGTTQDVCVLLAEAMSSTGTSRSTTERRLTLGGEAPPPRS
jgi:hypothetical protein